MLIDVTDSVLVDRICEAWHEAVQRTLLPNEPGYRVKWADLHIRNRDRRHKMMIAFLAKLPDIALAGFEQEMADLEGALEDAKEEAEDALQQADECGCSCDACRLCQEI